MTLETYSINEIAEMIRERSVPHGSVVQIGDHYLDVSDKVGKEVFGPLANEGIYVVAVLPREHGVRVWFDEETDA
jgi:hypothetical protein